MSSETPAKNLVTRGAYALPGTSLAFKTGTWRSERPAHLHRIAPCHHACPAGEDPQAWLALIQEDRLQEAWTSLVHANPLPAVTGRVCPHPCEQSCNRGSFDSSVAIHNIERFLGDEALRNGWSYPRPGLMTDDDLGVAVVGAGPAGLSAAYHLARTGRNVTLFEATPECGGLLRSAIPMTRLPRTVLDQELERLLETAIEVNLRHRLGRDISLRELQAEYAAIFLAPGCQKPKPWDIAGAVPADLHDGLHLLKEWVDHGTVPVAPRVVVHGGGNTALDISRIMLRHGAQEVHLVTASGLPGPDTAPDDVLNVVPRELEEAVEEGVRILPHCHIQRLILRGSKIVGVELVSLKKLPAGNGRRARIAFEGTERVLDVDMVVPCIGEAVDPAGLKQVLVTADYFSDAGFWGDLPGHPGVFVGGDARGDRGTVSAAVGDGRRAALAIERFLRSQRAADQPKDDVIEIDRLNLNYFEPAPRETAPRVAPAERTDDTEIEGDLTPAQVGAEAARCFSCGNCLACDNCWTLCPDNAVVKTVEVASDGSHYLFDYDYCKGCGLCARECPCGYIVMQPEP